MTPAPYLGLELTNPSLPTPSLAQSLIQRLRAAQEAMESEAKEEEFYLNALKNKAEKRFAEVRGQGRGAGACPGEGAGEEEESRANGRAPTGLSFLSSRNHYRHVIDRRRLHHHHRACHQLRPIPAPPLRAGPAPSIRSPRTCTSRCTACTAAT